MKAVTVAQPLSEHQIMDQIISLLNNSGYYAWRNNVGSRPYVDKYGKKRFVKFGQAGMSDIFAIQSATGRFVALEVKRPTTRKNVTWYQKNFIELIRHHNGIAAVVCSLEEAAKLLDIKLLF